MGALRLAEDTGFRPEVTEAVQQFGEALLARGFEVATDEKFGELTIVILDRDLRDAQQEERPNND